MPAFDPVRDAVLNSPIAKSTPLRLPSPAHSNPFFPPSPVPSSATASPTLRRATDLSVLLNDNDSTPSPKAGPSSARPRSSHLSHILHDSSPSSILNQSPTDILQPSLSRADTTPLSTPTFAHSVRKISTPEFHRLPTPTSAGTGMSPSRATAMAVEPPAPPMPTASSSSNPPRSTIPYAPRNRRTTPDSVLKPLTPAEIELYRKLRESNPLRARYAPLKRKHEQVEPPVGSVAPTKPGKRKGKEEDSNSSARPTKRSRDSGIVVEHYNARPDVGVDKRQESPIIGLKSFNNWVKSVLIARFAHPALKAGSKTPGGGRILDIGCGKGGDLNKWQKSPAREYVGLDIAALSISQARQRYSSHITRLRASFHTLDCYTQPLTAALAPSSLPPEAQPFDVVSMQFCMHYAFENVQKARMMLENVTRWLRTGGVFVGTIPNAELLMKNLDAMKPTEDPSSVSFGNSVYKIRFEDADKRPMFGHRYWFFLLDAVEDVPEYVVHWDNFLQLASEYSLHLVYRAEFHDVFSEHHEHPEFGQLLQRMKVVDANGESQMDEEQWEAANIYIAFAFEKR